MAKRGKVERGWNRDEFDRLAAIILAGVQRSRDFWPDGKKAGCAKLSRPTGYGLCRTAEGGVRDAFPPYELRD